MKAFSARLLLAAALCFSNAAGALPQHPPAALLIPTLAAPPAIAAPIAPPELPKDPIAIYREGMSARQKKDAARYLAAFTALRERWPDDPDYLFRQAGALALSGRPKEAVPLLRRVIAMEVYQDLEGEPDLAALRPLPEFAELRAAMEKIKAHRVANATVGFRLTARQLFPEGIAWDPKGGDFFLSGQLARKIVRVSPKGEAREFIAPGAEGIGMVFGLRVDAPRGLLWAISTAEPVMRGYTPQDAGKTGLFAFELASGKLRARFWLPQGASEDERSTLDDLTVAADGRVYASESTKGAIYTATADSKALEALIAPGGISYPNGLDVTPDGKRLYVSDYSTGIFAVDLASRKAVALTHPPELAVNGIDGLAYGDGGLYAVQNGVNPPRVLRLALSPDGLAITKGTILEMNTPEMEEPTLGVLTGDSFCFVANSHDGKLRAKGGLPKAEELTPPTVLCLKR